MNYFYPEQKALFTFTSMLSAFTECLIYAWLRLLLYNIYICSWRIRLFEFLDACALDYNNFCSLFFFFAEKRNVKLKRDSFFLLLLKKKSFDETIDILWTLSEIEYSLYCFHLILSVLLILLYFLFYSLKCLQSFHTFQFICRLISKKKKKNAISMIFCCFQITLIHWYII